MQSLSLLSLLAVPSFATKLLLPLYQYPAGTTWNPVFSSIEANPQLEFQVIINVDSGPGGPLPDSDFVTGTAKLNSYSNVVTLGYVHVLYGAASQAEITQNVTDWATWNSYTGANVSVDGIFFDETPNSEGSAGANDVSFMQSAVSAATSAFGTHAHTIMFNPGSTVEHAEYYDLADYVVIYENEAASYSASILTSNIPAGRANQSSILIPQFASVGTAAEAHSWLQAMSEAGVGSAHILNYDYIQATSADAPAGIESVASALAGVQGVLISSSTAAAASPSSTTIAAPTSTVATLSTSKAASTSTTVVSSETEAGSSGQTTSSATEATYGADPTTAVAETSGDAEPTKYHPHRHHHWMRAHGAHT